ncbi:MAG: hypothetical protein ACPGTP_04790 [Bacteroidia bacterium]
MRIYLIVILCVLVSCTNSTERENSDHSKNGTYVDRIEVSNSTSGSSYITKAHSYFVVTGSDTSSFKPTFGEMRSTKDVFLRLALPYSKENISYTRRMEELHFILSEAGKEYDLSALNSISYGRLILSGELALAVHSEIEKNVTGTETITTGEYAKIEELIMNSVLSEDLNTVLEPHQLAVKKISIQKAFFTKKEELLAYNQIEDDSTHIPDHIFDCNVWVQLENR